MSSSVASAAAFCSSRLATASSSPLLDRRIAGSTARRPILDVLSTPQPTFCSVIVFLLIAADSEICMLACLPAAAWYFLSLCVLVIGCKPLLPRQKVVGIQRNLLRREGAAEPF